MPAPFLSLAVLAYNEKETLERAASLCSSVLEVCGRTYELVLVDDGSTDGSREIIQRSVKELPHCRAIYHGTNLGIGAGIRTCYFETLGQWATWFPADLQADPSELPRLVELLPECDVLITYRDPWQRREKLLRKVISFTERALVSLLFGVSLRDLHWIRFFRRELLNRMILSSRSPCVDNEMVVHAKKLGARIRQAPLADKPREFGTAKGARVTSLVWAATDLISLWLRGIESVPEGQVATPGGEEFCKVAERQVDLPWDS